MTARSSSRRPRRSGERSSSSCRSRSPPSRRRTSSTTRPTPIRSGSCARTRRGRRAPCTRTARSRSGSTRPSHLDGRVYGEARDADDAAAMLAELAGHTHEVVSGLCLLGDGFASSHEVTRVTFRDLSAAEIARYLRRGVGGQGGRLRDSGARRPPRRACRRATISTSSGCRRRSCSTLSPGHVPNLLQIHRVDCVPHELVPHPHRLRRARHGRRPRHGEHARLRPRPGDRALGAVGRRDRPAHRGRARGRGRGEAHARAHAGHDLRDPAAQGRRHRGLRRHRADAAPLHPEGAPAPLRAPARRRLRPVRGDRSREARGRGGDATPPGRATRT